MSQNDEWKQRAREQFAGKRQTGALVEIPVEEWGTSLYFWPEMTMNERRAILMGYRNGDHLLSMVECIIARARDRNGVNVFSTDEREILLERYDPRVIEKICDQILERTSPPPTVEEASKN